LLFHECLAWRGFIYRAEWGVKSMSTDSPTASSEHRTIRNQKFVIFGMLLALVFAVVGFDVVQGASAAPSSIYTCTKNGVKFKIVATPVCKAGKHPQTLNIWDNDATAGPALATALKYETIDHGGALPADGDFTGLSFANTYVPLIFGHFGVSSTWANFSGDNFTSAKLFLLEGSNFSGANFTGATFYPEVLGDPAPQGSFGTGPASGDNFSNANFTSAVFDGQVNNFEGDNFNGANFTGTNIDQGQNQFQDVGSTFVGAIWSNTSCPDGTNSNTNVGLTCLGHGM
jgi:hypothetical protein